jgi:hypothetical protein
MLRPRNPVSQAIHSRFFVGWVERSRNPTKKLSFVLRARDALAQLARSANVPQPNLGIKAFFRKGEGIVKDTRLETLVYSLKETVFLITLSTYFAIQHR